MRFKSLIKIIPSARKAQLVDYILLGWQSSTYTLKNSECKWFMKPYSEIVEDTGIPKSTLERYIKELHEEGFIERRQALYSRTKEQGGFEVKKGNYIYITDKLLSLIKHSQSDSNNLPVETTSTPIALNDTHKEIVANHSNIKPECNEIDNNEGTEPLILRGLYIRDLYSSLKDNIIFKKNNLLVDKEKSERLFQQMETIHNTLYLKIKEEIPDEVKKLVLGTFYNLTINHQKQLSNPSQVVAEYLFELINTEFYMPSVQCFKHRNNILSKILRQNNWKTPKGFYSYFYLGQDYKDQQEIREQRWKKEKEKEISGIGYELLDPVNQTLTENVDHEVTHSELLEIENKIYEKGDLLNKLEKEIYKQCTEELILVFRERIMILREELQILYQRQKEIENEIELKGLLKNLSLCA